MDMSELKSGRQRRGRSKPRDNPPCRWQRPLLPPRIYQPRSLRPRIRFRLSTLILSFYLSSFFTSPLIMVITPLPGKTTPSNGDQPHLVFKCDFSIGPDLLISLTVSEPTKPSLISPYLLSKNWLMNFPGLYEHTRIISRGVKLCSFISQEVKGP